MTELCSYRHCTQEATRCAVLGKRVIARYCEKHAEEVRSVLHHHDGLNHDPRRSTRDELVASIIKSITDPDQYVIVHGAK